MARTSRHEWAKRIKQWDESGLTGAAFAGRIGVKEATLRHWKWQLGRHARASRRGGAQRVVGPAFVEIAPLLTGHASGGEPFELVLGDDVRVRVPASFDEASLRRLLAVLRGQ
jgi:transposase-like protein